MKYTSIFFCGERVVNKIRRTVIYIFRKRQFVEYHFSDTIKKPIIITPHCIVMKENVRIYHHARIEGVSAYRGKHFRPRIVLGKYVSIQQNIHLTCANSITIGENTAIAANVTITDIHHPYIDIDTPIEYQEIEVKPVSIGDDCKIYNNVVILPGTQIGKHVTIGANSVVSGVFPDFCVIAGIPARIIRCYNKESKQWQKVN